jgi:hypothetical protein
MPSIPSPDACGFRVAPVALLALFWLLPCMAAQDPILDVPEEEPVRAWRMVGDLWLGYDHVSGLPNDRSNLERVRGRLRLGAAWTPSARWELVGALHVAQGSDANRDNRRNNDNERSDGIGLDRLLARWQATDSLFLQLGKAPLPLELSPMVWDDDLRPAGIALDQSFAIGEFDRLQFIGGWFAGEHLYGDESHIGAIQLAWRWREGAPTRAGVLLAYLDYNDLDELTRQGLARTNSIGNGRLRYDYRLLDLQLVGRTELAQWPIEARFDFVRNLGADADRDGLRASITVGDRGQARGWEFGWAWQRIGRDAVMAAFNSDDWWFHSAARGHMPWIGYGIDATWALRLAGFHEKRDGLDHYTDRVMLDLRANW